MVGGWTGKNTLSCLGLKFKLRLCTSVPDGIWNRWPLPWPFLWENRLWPEHPRPLKKRHWQLLAPGRLVWVKLPMLLKDSEKLESNVSTNSANGDRANVQNEKLRL